MTRYLVVAHETVTNPELLKQLRAVREQEGEAEFVLLVPATPVRRRASIDVPSRGAVTVIPGTASMYAMSYRPI